MLILNFEIPFKLSSYLWKFRYVLKRRFDRGSYGEVWLAFHWNCSGDVGSFSSKHKSFTHFVSDLHLNPYGTNMNAQMDSSDKHCFNDSSDDTQFILKRIMVNYEIFNVIRRARDLFCFLKRWMIFSYALYAIFMLRTDSEKYGMLYCLYYAYFFLGEWFLSCKIIFSYAHIYAQNVV